ncbi:MAG: cell division protein FtsA [Candidatus Hydrogenedentes bacterium]|nr:cell division protein FtsA [Candidatus Hydrogenedentota bacterium]
MGIRGEIVGAVDFGSREIRVVIARRDEDGVIQIIGHGCAPVLGSVAQGVVQDRAVAQGALKRALNAAEKEARTKAQILFVGIGGRNVETFIREGRVEIDRGVVDEEHLIRARKNAANDIDVPGKKVASSITSQEWYVDDIKVLDPIGIRGEWLKTRVHFARIPAVIVENLVGCILGLGRPVEGLVFQPLASAMGCLTQEDMELGVAMLDMGRNTTGLAVYRDHRILGTHCFEWGGYHITRDVAAGLQVSFEEADELCLTYGISRPLIQEEFGRKTADPDSEEPEPDHNKESTARIKLKTAVPGAPSIVDRRVLDLIIYERAKELMVKVRQHLQSRGLLNNLVRGIVLTGGASHIKNYVALAEAVFQSTARVGAPINMTILPHQAARPEFSAAVGIVRHAYEYRAAVARGRLESGNFFRNVLMRLIRWAKRLWHNYFG